MNSEHLNLIQPIRSPDALYQWLRFFLGLHIPRHSICPGHSAPFDYLVNSYFQKARDLVVWAPRGGGKTRLGAAATLLDLLHRPACEVRILGGSLEQSLRMWEHLWPDVEKLAFDDVAGRIKSRGLRMNHGGGVAVVTQSQRAVRGLRVQKLRCDEVEMFDPEVWEAAQMVTKSRVQASGFGVQEENLGRSSLNPEPRTLNPILGSIEAISTYHRPGGLMEKIIDQARRRGSPVIRWCLIEVLERCARDRQCAACALSEECAGAAKEKCEGFVSIDDALAIKGRVSRETWDCEMLCRRPSGKGCVFGHFDPAVHVTDSLSLIPRPPVSAEDAQLSLAIDFGFANPFVCLWVIDDGSARFVIDEYVQEQRMVEEHAREIESRPWGRASRIACDPAGAGRNEQTAMSNVQLLRQRGYIVRYRRSLIVEGLEMIRAALRPATGSPSLFIHPRCQRLIAAMKGYRYEEGGGEIPLKDGVHDHLIDALRYYYVNRRSGELIVRRY